MSKVTKTPAKRGRPTKYKPEFCQQLRDFFDVPLFITIDVQKMSASGAVKIIQEREANDMPLFKCFCREIGITFETFCQWTKEKQDFSDSYRDCKGIQEKFILHHSLGNRYNATFAKFFAINNLGMKETSHVETKNEHKVEGYGLAFDLTKKPDDI